MKRQRGRGRKPGGGGGGGGGGGNHNHGNRSLESNGPDVKIRGTAAQIYEKYAQYARDAQSGGDRVKYETYLQHAEHYYRVMAATMPRERLLQQQNGEGGFQQGQPMGGEGHSQPNENSVPGEQPDTMRTSDAPMNDADDGEDEVEAAEAEEGEEAEAAAPTEAAQDQEGAGRNRRRRGRRRPNDGDRPSGGGGGGSDPEARSALDSLARKQGALTGG
jgi:Domain of unknown function (DUF4167)